MRRQIDPKTLRKHSRLIEKQQDPVLVAGDRDQTDYGYVIEGHKSKSFETKYVCIMPHGVTPKWQHEKKTRVLRVVGGVGHYETFADNGEIAVRALTFGDEIVIAPRTVYRIRSSATKLEFFVTQDAKYEAALKELAPAEAVVPVPAAELQSLSQEDKTHRTNIVLTTDRSMRRNRAREQLQMQRAQLTKPESQPGQRPSTPEDTFFRNGAAQNFNAMPVASFDPDGAG